MREARCAVPRLAIAINIFQVVADGAKVLARSALSHRHRHGLESMRVGTSYAEPAPANVMAYSASPADEPRVTSMLRERVQPARVSILFAERTGSNSQWAVGPETRRSTR